jgi:hypothetical protein
MTAISVIPKVHVMIGAISLLVIGRNGSQFWLSGSSKNVVPPLGVAVG